MRRQIVVPSTSGLVWRMVDWAVALGRGVRRAVIRSVAIVAMLVIYAVTSLGSIGTTALGVVGLSSAALVATSTPASARWRRRYYRRRHYWRGPWRWRRRRRWRRW